MDVCGPPLPQKFPQSVQSDHASKHLDLNPTTRILNLSTTRSNLKGCVPKLRSFRTRKNTRFGQSTILSRLQPMNTDVYGPPLPPKFPQSVQSDHASKHSDLQSDHSDPQSEYHSEQPKRVCFKAKKHLGKKKHKVRAKYYSQSPYSTNGHGRIWSSISSKVPLKCPV